MIKTFSYRIKDSTTGKHLAEHARSVNFVWNFINDSQRHALKWDKPWPSRYDLQKLTSGSSKALNLHSQTIQALCKEYPLRLHQTRKRWLRYRGKRSLGWIPFTESGIKVADDGYIYQGRKYRVWEDRPLEGRLACGSFSQDARGRWYINLTCEVDDPEPSSGTSAIGIDLGLKDMATMSDGEKIEAKRFYRDLEPKLGKAQRANKKRQVKAIHAKIKNRRKDFLHKESTRLVEENAAIFVGDANSSRLAKTKMAKSVLDAGWSTFRTYLGYKANARQVMFEIVDERYTTQVCSNCGCLPDSRPKGIAALGIREWCCSECGMTHDRDQNAAANILRLGHQALAGGNPHYTARG